MTEKIILLFSGINSETVNYPITDNINNFNILKLPLEIVTLIQVFSLILKFLIKILKSNENHILIDESICSFKYHSESYIHNNSRTEKSIKPSSLMEKHSKESFDSKSRKSIDGFSEKEAILYDIKTTIDKFLQDNRRKSQFTKSKINFIDRLNNDKTLEAKKNPSIDKYISVYNQINSLINQEMRLKGAKSSSSFFLQNHINSKIKETYEVNKENSELESVNSSNYIGKNFLYKHDKKLLVIEENDSPIVGKLKTPEPNFQANKTFIDDINPINKCNSMEINKQNEKHKKVKKSLTSNLLIDKVNFDKYKFSKKEVKKFSEAIKNNIISLDSKNSIQFENIDIVRKKIRHPCVIEKKCELNYN